MTATEWQRLCGAAAAVAVPAFGLHLSADAARTDAGLTVPLFDTARLLVAHLGLALPLGLLLASWLKAVPTVRQVAPALWVVAGAVLIGLTAAAAPGLADGLIADETGFQTLLVVRAVLALGLVLPWCVLAVPATPPGEPPLAQRLLLLGAMGLAVVPAGFFTQSMLDSRGRELGELLDRGRVVRAARTLDGLRELGQTDPIRGQPPRLLAARLADQRRQLEAAAAGPLPPGASPTARLERALVLIALNRLAEAEELLAPEADGDNLANLLLATVEQEQERYADSDRHFEAAYAAATARTDADPAVVGTALDGLIFNARAARAPNRLDRWLREAVERLPDRRAEFTFQQGRHYAELGRPERATRAYEQARELDPARFGPLVDQELDHLRTTTPVCVLNRSPRP